MALCPRGGTVHATGASVRRFFSNVPILLTINLVLLQRNRRFSCFSPLLIALTIQPLFLWMMNADLCITTPPGPTAAPAVCRFQAFKRLGDTLATDWPQQPAGAETRLPSPSVRRCAFRWQSWFVSGLCKVCGSSTFSQTAAQNHLSSIHTNQALVMHLVVLFRFSSGLMCCWLPSLYVCVCVSLCEGLVCCLSCQVKAFLSCKL